MSAGLRNLAMLLAVSAAAGSTVAQTCDWRWVNPAPPRIDLYRLKQESNAFVAVGATGTILRSGDGYTWRLVPSGVGGDLYGVDWGAGVFVAVGDGAILRSTAGLEWATVYEDPGLALRDVEFSASRFVAVGAGLDGHVLTSALGRDWETVEVPWQGDPDSIAGSNAGFFVALGTDIWFSPDGFDWEYQGAVPAQARAVAGSGRIKKTGIDLFELGRIDLAWTGSRLLWAGGSELWSRDDDEKWTLVAALGGCQPWSDWLGLTAGQGWALASGVSGCPTPYLDPTVLLTVSFDGGASFQNPWETELGGFPGLARYGARWVAVGALGDILVSSNGATWDCHNGSCTSLACADDFVDLASDPDRGWLAVGGVGLCEEDLKRRSGGTTATSTAGTSWSIHPQATDLFRGVTVTAAGYLAVGDGWVARSTDGRTWTTGASPDGAVLRAVGSGDGWIVAAGQGGDLYVSDDGASWFKPFLYVSADLGRVVWGDGQFLVLGDRGTILRSHDAMNWEAALANTDSRLTGAAVGPEGWIMVGADGTVLASDDGAIWLPRRSGFEGSLRDVVWGDGRFVAVGWEDGAGGTRPAAVLASEDGVHWTSFAAPGEALNRIHWTGSSWLAVGGERTIIVTDCLGTMIETSDEHLQVPLGQTVDLLVSLSEAVATDTELSVRSSRPDRAIVPPTVTIPAGGDSVYVPVTGAAVVLDAVLTLTLPEDEGGGSTTGLVSVQPPQWRPRKPTGRVRP